MSAAIASVLDLKIEEVPSFWEYDGGEWLAKLFEFARSIGVGLLYCDSGMMKRMPLIDGCYVIAGGPTPRSEKYFHAVVARAVAEHEVADGVCCSHTKLEWVHDLAPGGGFLTEVDHVIAFFGSPSRRPAPASKELVDAVCDDITRRLRAAGIVGSEKVSK